MAEEKKVATEEVKAEKPAEVKADAKKDARPNKGAKKFSGSKNFKKKEEKVYEERVVDINRISKTVQGGRHMRFSALVVVGDKKGKYGFALEKSGEVPDAMKKSIEAAKHNIHTLHIVKGATISHEVTGKFGATKVYLKPAPAGTGIIAGGPVRAILELAGLKNVVSKVYGARASINVIRATDNAISQLKSYHTVRQLRGLEDNTTTKGE